MTIGSSQLQLLRDADPGVVLPGIDTPVGNPLPASSLTSYTSISQSVSAPYHYIPSLNLVVVTQDGAVLSGINFGTAQVNIDANNVTIKDSTFAGSTGVWGINQLGTYSGAIIEDNSFTGAPQSSMGTFISANYDITVEDNSFIDAPADAIHVGQGIVTGNYIAGGGYTTGAHADAIYVGLSTGPVSITDNFVDWTPNADAATGTNNAIRITNELGDNSSGVVVSGNYLIGGGYPVAVGSNGSSNTLGNVSVINNYIGFSQFGTYWPNSEDYATLTGNTIFDYSNPVYSDEALAAYEAAGVPTANVISATGPTASLSNTSSAPTTLIGDDLATHLYGSNVGETVIIGGAGRQFLIGGQGANLFTYLAVSDSAVTGVDSVGNFDPAKDVIDLSAIDADLTTPGVQNFTFIGDAPFSGNGAQVRFEQEAGSDVTLVQAKLAGDPSADLVISLTGTFTLSAANFALTAAQSSADLANGAALSEMRVAAPAKGPTEIAYGNVIGRNYSSYDAFYASGTDLSAEDLFLNSPPPAPSLPSTPPATTPTSPAAPSPSPTTHGALIKTAPVSNLPSFLAGLNASMASMTTPASTSGASPAPSGNELVLYDAGMTIDRAGGTEALVIGGQSTPLSYYSAETIDASDGGAENFVFGANFGQETIYGFAASGANADSIQLAASSFSYLTPDMTQAQDLAAVLAHAASSASGVTITASRGDSLTLAGLTVSTLAANPSAFHFS